jgi:hypothetical protein
MQLSYNSPPKHLLKLKNVNKVAACLEEFNVHKISMNWGI